MTSASDLALMVVILLYLPEWTDFATCKTTKCSLCETDGRGHEVNATCTDIVIQKLPDTLVHLTVNDVMSPDTLPLYEFMDFILTGKTALQTLHIENYGIRELKGRCFASCVNLFELDLSKNEIHSMEPENFYGLIKLTDLNLNRNNLTKINDNVFNSLVSLKKLNIALNSLTEITNRTFHGLKNLERLILQSNKIDKIPHDTFQELVQLNYIDLQNNTLRTIAAGVFKGLNNLRTVDLQNNLLHTLDRASMAGAPVTFLNLQHNNFTEIPTELLVSISNKELEVILLDNYVTELKHGVFHSVTLKTLYLTYNLIHVIEQDAFDNCQIQKVDLQNNSLTTFPKSAEHQFSQTEFLLANNSWSCDCKIQWLANVLMATSKDNISQSKIPECSRPLRYHGHKLTDIGYDLIFECDLIYYISNVLSIPVPPTHEFVTPKLNRRTVLTELTTVSTSTTDQTVKSSITPTIEFTKFRTKFKKSTTPQPKNISSSDTNISVIVGAIIAALVLICILVTVLVKKFVKSGIKVYPDSTVDCRKADINFKPLFTRTDTEC